MPTSIEQQEEEQLSMNKGKELKDGDLVLVRNFSRTKLEPSYNGFIQKFLKNSIQHDNPSRLEDRKATR